MEENKNIRKNKVLYLLIIGLIIALIAAFFMISDLSNEIDNLRNSHIYAIDDLRNNINSIYVNVDEKLKKQASLFSKIEYEYGELDTATKKAKLSLTVVPKTLVDEMKLSVTIGNESVYLVRNGNEFNATVLVDLFLEYGTYPMLTIQTADSTQTEYPDDIILDGLYNTYLPTPRADMSASSTFNYGASELRVNGTLNISDYSDKGEFEATVKSYTLVTEVNGKETDKKDITSEVMAAEDGYTASFNETYKIKKSDKLRIYVIAEDTLGFIHKSLAYSWQDSDIAPEIIAGDFIYDSQGNLLYGEEY